MEQPGGSAAAGDRQHQAGPGAVVMHRQHAAHREVGQLRGAGREADQAVVREWAARVALATDVRVLEDAALLLATDSPDAVGNDKRRRRGIGNTEKWDML